MGRRPMSAGLARTERVEAKITPMERAALAERRGDMTESDAIRAALAAWCASSPDSALDPRFADLVEQAVARGFIRAMTDRTARTPIVLADPIAQEERAAILAALTDERDETLAARLGLTVSQLTAVRSMKARAPRLTDEQRAALGLAPRQLQLPVGDERRDAEAVDSPVIEVHRNGLDMGLMAIRAAVELLDASTGPDVAAALDRLRNGALAELGPYMPAPAPVAVERRAKERREPPAPPEPGASTVKVRRTKRGGTILVADERTAERREQ